MHDDEFEKRIQQQMAGLRLRPEDSVWNNVEKELYRKGNRRRYFLWLPLLILGIGVGIFTLLGPPLSRRSKTTEGLENTANRTPNSKVDRDLQAKPGPVKSGQGLEIPMAPPGDTNLGTASGDALAAPAPNPRKGPASTTANPASTSTQEGDILSQPRVARQGDDEERALSSHRFVDAGSRQIEEVQATDDMNRIFPRLSELPRTAIHIPFKPLNGQAPVSIRPLKRRKLSGWQWGISLEGGRSSLNDGKLKGLFQAAALADRSYNYAQGGVFAIIYTPPSAINPGFAFSGGLFVKKRLAPRIALELGLQYNQFSTSNKVGKKMDSSIIVQPAMSGDQNAVEEYFRAGNTDSYTNRYHFIDVPVSLEAQLIRSRVMPVYLNLGISASRLIASNALHFDGSSRIYYRDNDLLHKTQFNTLTGLSVRLFPQKKISLQAGPEFRYGLTKLLSNESGGDKHLLFVGLKAKLLLGK